MPFFKKFAHYREYFLGSILNFLSLKLSSKVTSYSSPTVKFHGFIMTLKYLLCLQVTIRLTIFFHKC